MLQAMRTNLFIILVITCMGSFYDTSGQNNFYWSGKRKINLTVDSSQTLIYLKNNTNMESVKSLIQDADLSTQISDVPIRQKMILIVKNSNARIQKFLLSNSIEGIENQIPVYTLDKVPYYFTEEILLQPKKWNFN